MAAMPFRRMSRSWEEHRGQGPLLRDAGILTNVGGHRGHGPLLRGRWGVTIVGGHRGHGPLLRGILDG